MISTPNDANTALYKKVRNNVVNEQRKDKKRWAEKLLERDGNKSKNMWQTIKKISGDHNSKTINKIMDNGVTITNKMDIANKLNEFFISKVQKLVDNIPHETKNVLEELQKVESPEREPLKLMTITMTDLNILIKNMKKNWAW